MASFNSLVITAKGQALIAKMMAGTATPKFTKINCSEMDYSGYQVEQLQNIVTLSDVKQVEIISEVKRINQSEVKVSAVLTNSALDVGYYLKAIGLYAIDPAEGEVLYAIAVATTPDWIPSKALNVSSMSFDFITDVSNSENISLEVEPAAVATERQLELAKRNFAMASENNMEAIREAIPSGFTKFNDIDFSYGITNPNKIKLTGNGVAFVNGFKVVIPEGTVIDVGEPPTEGERDDLIFLEVWRAQETDTEGQTIQSRIRVVQGVDFDTYRLDGFAVSAIGAIGDNTGSHNNVHITAQGGLFAPITLNDSELWRTCFMSKYVRRNSVLGVTKTAIDDVGVYVAGQGDQISRDALKTADGYVYAIPMFKVRRRNSGGYSVSNPNGAIGSKARESTGASTPVTIGKIGEVIVFTMPTLDILIGDVIFWNVKDFSYEVTEIVDDSTLKAKALNSTRNSVFWSGYIFKLVSDRPDLLYSDVIENGDVFDIRHQVSLTGFNYQSLLEKNFDKLLRGDLQTKEREKMVKTYHGIPKTPIDEHTVFYMSCNGTKIPEINNINAVVGMNSAGYDISATGIGIEVAHSEFGIRLEIPLEQLDVSKPFTVDALIRIKKPMSSSESAFLLQVGENGIYSRSIGSVAISRKSAYKGGIYHVRITNNSVSYVNGKIINNYRVDHDENTGKLHIRIGSDCNASAFSPGDVVISDIMISNIDREDVFVTLPKDFIDGYADIAPSFSDQRKNHSDALISQTTAGIATLQVFGKSSSGITPSKVGGTWANGDTIKVKGLGGEIISGVIDSNTSIAKAYKAVGNKIYMESVVGLSVGDTFTIANRTEYISTEDFSIVAIDAVNKTIDINWSGQFDPAWIGAQGYYLILETTASTSSPVVKSMVESTLTEVDGTWSGLGTNEATFTIATSAGLPIGDIEIQYSLSSASGNGVIPVFKETLGGEANGKNLFIGTVAVTDDYKGKITESTAINPSKAFEKYTTTLQTPSNFSVEFTSNKYDAISNLDTILASTSALQNGYIPQQLFSFNIIREIEDKYGAIPSVDKVAWILNNVQGITCNWIGYGSSPNGNNAYLSLYTKSDDWVGAYNHSLDSANVISFYQSSYTPIANAVMNDGFIHFLAYTDASDGIIPSVLYTDYVNIEVTLKTLAGYDLLVPENPRRDAGVANVLLVRKETKEVQSFFDATNTDGIVTYGNYDPYQGLVQIGESWFSKDKVLAEIYSISTIGTGKVCSDKNSMYKGLSTRLPIQGIKDYQLDSEIESNGEVTDFLRITSLLPVSYGAYKSILYREVTSSISEYYYMVERGVSNCIFGSAENGFLMSKACIPIVYKGYAQHIVAYLMEHKSDGELYMIINTSTNNEGIFSTTGKGNYATDVYRLEGRPLIKEA